MARVRLGVVTVLLAMAFPEVLFDVLLYTVVPRACSCGLPRSWPNTHRLRLRVDRANKRAFRLGGPASWGHVL
jgi:hypothetical protein